MGMQEQPGSKNHMVAETNKLTHPKGPGGSKLFGASPLQSYFKLLLPLLAILLALPFYIVKSEYGFVFAPTLALDPNFNRVSFGISFALPIIAAVILLYTLTFSVKQIRSERWLLGLPIAIIGWMSIALVFGALSGAHVSIILYLQTILPLVMFAVLLTAETDTQTLRRSLDYLPVFGTLTIVSIALTLVWFLQTNISVVAYAFTAEALYSAKNIQPVVVAIGLVILLQQLTVAMPRFPVHWLWIMTLIHIGFVFINWSRSGLLLIGVAFGTWLISQFIFKNRAQWRLPLYAVLSILLGVTTIASMKYGGLHEREISLAALKKIATEKSVAETTIKSNKVRDDTVQPKAQQTAPVTPARKQPAPNKPEKRQTVPDTPTKTKAPKTTAKAPATPRKQVAKLPAEKVKPKTDAATQKEAQKADRKDYRKITQKAQKFGDSRRLLLSSGALERISANPLFGDRFTPLEPGTEVSGRVVGEFKVYPAHNQYLDLAIRSGVPALLLYLAFFGVISAVIWKNRNADLDLAICALGIVAAIAIGCMFQAYLVVTQTATVTFLFLAFTIRLLTTPSDKASG